MHEYSDGDLNVTLPMLSDWCGSNGIPLLLEEFGGRQQIGDQERADYLNLVYSRARQYSVVGIGLWNLGPRDRTHKLSSQPVDTAGLCCGPGQRTTTVTKVETRRP